MDKEVLSNQNSSGSGTNASEIPVQKETEDAVKCSLIRVDSDKGSCSVNLERPSLDTSINLTSLSSQSDELSLNEVSNKGLNSGIIDLSVEELMQQARKLKNKSKKLIKRRKRRIERFKQSSAPASGKKNKRDRLVRLSLLSRGKNSSHSSQRYPRGDSENFSLSKYSGFQVVVMPEDCSNLSKLKLKTIGVDLILNIYESTIDSDGNPIGPQLRFINVCKVEEGWLLISCFDKVTMDWTLNWKPKDSGLKIIPYLTAPVKIAICIKATEVNLGDVSRVLQAQNRSAKVENWRHLITQQNIPGFWKVVFAVPLDIISLLVRQNLKLAYKTTVLKVNIISSRAPEDVTAVDEERK